MIVYNTSPATTSREINRQARSAAALADVQNRSECLQRLSFSRLPKREPTAAEKAERIARLKEAAARVQENLDRIKAEMEAEAK
jgi:hypothetical protein